MRSTPRQVEPDDAPRSRCPKHERTYDPYRVKNGRCPDCRREEIHEEARRWLAEQKRQRVDVELSGLDEDGTVPYPFEGDALVEWKGDSRLLRIQEVEDSERDGPYREFTVEGGFPIGWYENELVKGLASELGSRMMAIPRLV